MKYARTVTLFALCAALSACDVPDTSMMNGAVTLKDNVLTLHAKDAPDALISSDGALQIDGKDVPVTPAQRGLLMLYFQNVMDVHQTGAEMGKIGANIGANALKDTIDGKSKTEKDNDAKAGGGQLKTLGLKICQDQVNIKNVQDQIAASLPAFKPYSHIADDHDGDKCTKDDD
ncbi:hypothetical protein [Dyella sp. 2HG41-7]|uniref:hypothetical protein n=1 Tax=Dyella sp. 2HG41-7 TaxID=2883239 RepID=UPI001F312C1F|nr:hypothetical protein [Dyella sp. 2HG41-7]